MLVLDDALIISDGQPSCLASNAKSLIGWPLHNVIVSFLFYHVSYLKISYLLHLNKNLIEAFMTCISQRSFSFRLGLFRKSYEL